MARFWRTSSYDSAGRARIWPIVVVLASIVVLPSAGMVWALVDALESGRLARRAQLAEIWRPVLERRRDALDTAWRERLDGLDRISTLRSAIDAQRVFADCVLSGLAAGVVLRDRNGELLYPGTGTRTSTRNLGSDPESDISRHAEELEYLRADPAGAAEVYLEIASSSESYSVRACALRSAARCLSRAGKRDAALELMLDVAWDEELSAAIDAEGRIIALDVRLRALEIIGDSPSARFRSFAESLFTRISNYDPPRMPAPQRRFAMRKLASIWRECPEFPTFAAEELSAKHAATGAVPAEVAVLSRTRIDGVWSLMPAKESGIEALYAVDSSFAPASILNPSGSDRLASSGESARVELRSGREGPPENALLSIRCGGILADWRLDLVLDGADPFAQLASRKMAARVWIACLAIALSVALAVAGARIVGHRLRLSRMELDWTASVTHELRTPLANLRALVDTLLDGSYRDHEKAYEYLQLIERENERLSRLIDHVLTFSRVERNCGALERRLVAPAEIVDRAVALMRQQFDDGRSRLTADSEDDAPEVLGDADALVTVLVNLLENAYKYSGDHKRVVVRCARSGNRARFEVRDNGPGIAKSVRRRIFERFYRIDRSLTSAASGCGLGLSIVSMIVAAHGGSVEVSEAPGGGSIFAVELPAEGTADAVTDPAAESGTESGTDPATDPATKRPPPSRSKGKDGRDGN